MLSTWDTGAYAFEIFSKVSWKRVLLIKSKGSPSTDSTIISLVFLKLALDGEITWSIGLIRSAFSLKSAAKRILKDSSVPLVE